ncbi:MAG TPA: ATP-binding protein, partial [Gaiellaceae bacterium]|nr:ATP-binding protein [Gaiellaceae bacterium]
MFAAAPFGAELTDLEGNVLEANAALERMLGLSARDLTTLPRERWCDPDDDSRDRELFAELIAGDRTAYELDRRFKTGDGREMLGKVAVALVPDADGRPKYRLAFVEDVTRRAELEDRLRQSHRLEAVGRLAGGIAHDFNNLLVAINGYAEFALQRLGPGDTRGDVEEILKAGKRAGSLTAQLLAFSRKQMLQPKDLNFNHLVADMHNMLRRLIGEHIELSTAFRGPESLEVRADPGQLEQVVLNLVVNARDAMPNGGRITIDTSSVEIGADSPLLAHEGATPGEYAVLAVRDTGAGIAPKHLTQLFEPFFTTKDVGEGTGLGLATVYGIVRQSGGFVTVMSSPGAGATFEVYLPRVATDPGIASLFAEPTEPVQGRERVLLVEDETVVRELVREMLVRNGYEVLDAEDGPAALALVDRVGLPIDVLVTDVVMPTMNGRELSERLRVVSPDTFVLYTSGYT